MFETGSEEVLYLCGSVLDSRRSGHLGNCFWNWIFLLSYLVLLFLCRIWFCLKVRVAEFRVSRILLVSINWSVVLSGRKDLRWSNW